MEPGICRHLSPPHLPKLTTYPAPSPPSLPLAQPGPAHCPLTDTLCCTRPPHGTLLIQLLPSHDTLTPLRLLLNRLTAFLPCPPCWGLLRLPHPPTTGSRPAPGNTVGVSHKRKGQGGHSVTTLPLELTCDHREGQLVGHGIEATQLFTAAWEAWEQPADREQAMSGFARSAQQ